MVSFRDVQKEEFCDSSFFSQKNLPALKLVSNSLLWNRLSLSKKTGSIISVVGKSTVEIMEP
uniref:hypothetical protein n=1 Tax=Streptococcus suis TaxID=1307 RepID=UPI0019D36184